MNGAPQASQWRWNPSAETNARPSGDELVGQQVDCIATNVQDDLAFQIRFLAGSVRDIAAGMVKSDSVKQIQYDGLREWIPQVANGEITVR